MATARNKTALPGFGLSMGYTTAYLGLLVLIPLGVLVYKSTRLSFAEIRGTLADPVVTASFKLTLWTSALAAVISALFGLIIAWVLVRYRFPGRRFFDAIIDLPFALPTAVAGLTFSNLYTPTGWIGSAGHVLVGAINGLLSLVHAMRIFGKPQLPADLFAVSNTNAGIVVVLIFVGFPFVVRTIQPVLQEWQTENEQAAATLGAGRWTTFRRIIWPEIRPAFLTGLSLAFARAVGEYGSVIFIAANKPGESQIVPLQIIVKLFESDTYTRAHVIAAALLLISLLILLAVNYIEWRGRRHRVEA
jgi:sulfate/thiosulfate transport system permease protein